LLPNIVKMEAASSGIYNEEKHKKTGKNLFFPYNKW